MAPFIDSPKPGEVRAPLVFAVVVIFAAHAILLYGFSDVEHTKQVISVGGKTQASGFHHSFDRTVFVADIFSFVDTCITGTSDLPFHYNEPTGEGSSPDSAIPARAPPA